MGHAGVRELAGGLFIAAGRDVRVLPEGRVAEACDAESDLRRHDAVHVDRDFVHGHHVRVARNDVMATQLSLRRMISGPATFRKSPLIA